MIRILFTLLLLVPSIIYASDIKQVRKEFYAAVKDKEAAEEFYKKLKGQNLSDPILIAYYGSAQAIMAKHAWNPYRKISYLKSGLGDLKTAVARSPDCLEIRFLRFSVEHYLPSVLGFSVNLDEDRKKIIELIEKDNFGTADSTLIKNIITFLKKTNRFNDHEIAVLDEGLKNG